jgi:4-amino-4-deoxy-L-arabinose transferase-like glycosyltransferase
VDNTSTVERDHASSDTSDTPGATAPASRVGRAWEWVSGEEGRPRKTTIAAWIALALVWLAVMALLARWDFRETPRAGDENNWIIQSQSLAYDRNLSFDERDIIRWEQLDWKFTPTVRGVFFRSGSHGYGIAKPYGYAVWLAPFVRVFGAGNGIAAGNAALLTALLAVALAILRTRLVGVAVPLLAGAFTFASYVYFYAFTTSIDLFLAFVTGVGCLGFLLAWKHRSPWWAALGAAATAFALGDRVTVGFALLPALAVVLIRLGGWRQRVAVGAVGVIAFALTVFPYLWYSDFNSVSPYARPRFHTSTSGVPWATPVEEWRATLSPTAGQSTKPSHFTPSGVWTRITRAPDDVPESTAYFFVGRHTGLLTFLPLAFISFVLAAVWWRRLDRIGWGLLIGVLVYVGLYLVVYTNNYYGGGHSLGNRYFLQIAPVMLGVLAVLRPSARAALAITASCVVLSLAFLWPHHAEPETAYLHIDRTSAVQELLPFEHNQRLNSFFECAQGHGWAPPCLKPVGK